MYELVEFRHLRSFLTVAREGNFTRAADRLHLTQPALSTQIKQMEDGIPAQLFVREKTGVTLTPAGMALLDYAEHALRHHNQVLDAVQAIDRGTAPPLVLGFSLFIEHALVERTFASYQRLFPESDIRPSPQCTAQLLAWLGDGSINAALVTTPVKAHDLVIQPIARERLLLCLRKDDPLASADTILPRQIAEKLSITFDPKQHPELFSYLDSTLSRAGIAIQPRHLCTTPHDVQWMVKRGLGYALVRESRSLDSDLVARQIAGVELIAESAFVYRKSESASHLALLACDLKNAMRIPVTGRKKVAKEAGLRGRVSAQMKLLG
jgi:DNA-binding transcriptional LysR family regulator